MYRHFLLWNDKFLQYQANFSKLLIWSGKECKFMCTMFRSAFTEIISLIILLPTEHESGLWPSNSLTAISKHVTITYFWGCNYFHLLKDRDLTQETTCFSACTYYPILYLFSFFLSVQESKIPSAMLYSSISCPRLRW